MKQIVKQGRLFVFSGILIALVILSGCVQTAPRANDAKMEESTNREIPMKPAEDEAAADEEVAIAIEGDSVAGSERMEENDAEHAIAKNYYRYTEKHFDESLSAGKYVFLDFHANWCPVCVRERPDILSFFDRNGNANIAGYEVHFRDDESTGEDTAAQKKYGITLQHTKILIDPSGEVVWRSLEPFDESELLEQLPQ